MLYFEIIYFFLSLSLLALSSKVSFNIGLPAPITLQTYAIGLIILLAPKEIILLSIFTYVILAIIGLPIFSENSKGIKVLYGNTGGYIIGFLIVAFFFYFVKEASYFSIENIWLIFSWMLITHFIIIISGFCRLIFLIGYKEAFYNGVISLIIPAIIKSLMITLTFIIIKYV